LFFLHGDIVWDVHAGVGAAQLFLTLTPESFEEVRKGFGTARHVGSSMPPELPQSWTYTQRAWNDHARTPVTSAIESAAEAGDDSSVTFRLFGNGSKTKKKKKKKQNTSFSLLLLLPDNFDRRVHRIAVLADHFNSHYDEKQPGKLYANAVEYQPTDRELNYITRVLTDVLADKSTSDLSVMELYHQRILSTGLLSEYTGNGWEQWMINELKRIQLQPMPPVMPEAPSKSSPSDRAKSIALTLHTQGINDPALIKFVETLCRLAGSARSPMDIIDQWTTALKTCTSHWCPPPLWWCVGAVLSGENMGSITRVCEGGVIVAATCIENWDMLAVLHLFQSEVFSAQVHDAVDIMNQYTRRDIAHERFDCDWQRDWGCMADLLDALECPTEATALRAFCQAKTHTIDAGGSRVHTLCETIKICCCRSSAIKLIFYCCCRSRRRCCQANGYPRSLGEVHTAGCHGGGNEYASASQRWSGNPRYCTGFDSVERVFHEMPLI